MNTVWKKVKLGDLLTIKHGWAFKGEYFCSEGELILLTPGNFHEEGGFKIQIGKEKFYSGTFPKDYLLKKDDLIIAMTEQGAGLLGSPALVPKNNKFLHNQRLGLLQIDHQKAITKYIYYLFFTKEVRNSIASTATGTKVRHTAPKRVYNIDIPLPPLETQTQIANILSAYDDLIENNLRRIKLLEEMAEVYFLDKYLKNENVNKERVKLNSLVSFEIGGGWGEEEQNQEFNSPAFVIRGTDINNITTGKIENIPFRFHKKSNLSSRKLQHGDIIFEVSGGSQTEGVGKTILITNDLLKQFNSDIMCASFCKLLRPSKIEYSYFLNLLLKYFRKCKLTEVYEIRSASNIVNYNWSAFLKNQDILLPSDDFLDNFNNFIAPIIKQTLNLSHQNRLLKESRDILLPRLMSGELGV